MEAEHAGNAARSQPGDWRGIPGVTARYRGYSTRQLGSIRIDAYENIPEQSTVCVYDPKTGRRGLSFPRMNELAAAAHRLFGYKPDYIIVIEVRPGQHDQRRHPGRQLARKNTCVSIEMMQAPDAVSNQRHKLEAEGAMALVEIGIARWHSPQDAASSRNGSTPCICRNVFDTPPQLVEILKLRLGEFAQVEFGIGHRPLRVAI